MARLRKQLAAGLVLAVSAGAAWAMPVAQLDQPLFDNLGFTFGDMTAVTAPGVINISTTGFGGAGSDLTSPITNTAFDTATHQLEVEFTVLPGNTATGFNINLIDDDSPTTGDDFQYNFDLTGVTPGVQTTLVNNFTPGFNQAAFGLFIGDEIQNFGLRQIQIQSQFGSTDPLVLSVNRVSVVPIPEPGALALAGLGGLALLARRRGA